MKKRAGTMKDLFSNRAGQEEARRRAEHEAREGIRGPKIENRSWEGRVMDVWGGANGVVRFYLSEHEWFDVKIERGGVSVTSHPDPLLLQPMMGNYVVARQRKTP